MFENDNSYMNNADPIKEQRSHATKRYEFKVLLMQAIDHNTRVGLADAVRKEHGNQGNFLGIAVREINAFEMDLRIEDGTMDYIFLQQDFDVNSSRLKIMRIHKMTTAKIYEIQRGTTTAVAKWEIK